MTRLIATIERQERARTPIISVYREVLLWALRNQSLIDRGLPTTLGKINEHQATALCGISDPVKLSAIITTLLLDFGVGATCHAHVDGIAIWQPRAIGGHGQLLGTRQLIDVPMAQARTLALTLLELPRDDRMDRVWDRIAAALDEVL